MGACLSINVSRPLTSKSHGYWKDTDSFKYAHEDPTSIYGPNRDAMPP